MMNSNNWTPKLKSYPHFDAPISKKDAIAYVTNPASVKSHKFFPFLSYKTITKKFGSKKVKERHISYGARKDAYIYSYYRKLLMDKYEPLLKKDGLDECVIAYRKIPKSNQVSGKCNIDFANDAFEEISRMGNCVALALDISGFFESLHHKSIEEKWCRLLNLDRLEKDHLAVFKNITNYSIVDLNECYKILGHMEEKIVGGRKQKIYKHKREDQPKKLCSMEAFRAIIKKPLIQSNPNKKEKRGIPQGSPISDVIANMYMLDFDLTIKRFADAKSGYYRRYSDDILLIFPSEVDTEEIIDEVKNALANERGHLEIKDTKTIVTKFTKKEGVIGYESFDGNNNKKNNPFEYLGFSFDGQKKLIKNQTITRYQKKVIEGVRAEVKSAVAEAKKIGSKDPTPFIDISKLHHRYSYPNKNWKRNGNPPRNFITYATHAQKIMNSKHISNQIGNHKKFICKTIKKEISKATNS